MPSVTSKKQVTIPKTVREAMGIKPGDQVIFEETADGYVAGPASNPLDCFIALGWVKIDFLRLGAKPVR